MWKFILAGLATLNGGWMVFDGIHVLRNGVYYGADIPGPWRHVPEMFGVDPFSLGPVFAGLGGLWLISAIGTVMDPRKAYWPLLGIAVLTLWYVSIGTAISAIVIATLVWKGQPDG